MSARLILLPVLRCEGCGDEMVAFTAAPVCPRCVRRAELRRRLVQKPRLRRVGQ